MMVSSLGERPTCISRSHSHDLPQSGPVIPKYYYVAKEDIEAERAKPGSQERSPSGEGEGHNFFLWGQSVYIISQLLGEGIPLQLRLTAPDLNQTLVFTIIFFVERQARLFSKYLTAEC